MDLGTTGKECDFLGTLTGSKTVNCALATMLTTMKTKKKEILSS
jgi:hypothetical protein